MLGRNLVTSVLVILMLVGVTSFGWAWKSAGDTFSQDPDTLRQKRIEQRLERVETKLDQLIEIGSKWK